ncbi:tRNA pseudouridine(38-40) synthase TruA [Solitalea koreensis]|uniref:tRNA pseudouridine synthase A n=1 Tax=Solitalea koreensis TaxID=543615 RepID=A0A521DIF6_9SPHI|nr:tRNA pseudouridine(38-40) synthase TruA [Solitalea koreensis]SMO71365.1 tRNA pseudouridine38-40 synthase [Solitalea koreensis]
METTKNRYFIELAYKGTNFHGWQVQENAITVQEVLNKALSIVLREDIETLGCGRTDTGVHATDFFAHFDTISTIKITGSDKRKQEIDHDRLVRSVNSLIGYDIAVKRFLAVKPEAHARFDATARSYEYHLYFEKDPFQLEFGYLVKNNLNVHAMNEAAKVMMTYTDFSCFSKSNTQTFTNNCKISRAEWVNVGDKLVFYITADRFLRNMVRAIVGTLLDVGRGAITFEEVHKILESKNRSEAGTSVPASGLFLTKIEYPETIFLVRG